MPFSKTDTELIKAGYKFDNRGRCMGKDCQAEIEWWLTPKGKRIPLDAGTLEPHWSTCPNREDFRK
jgi:hypothetical protein